MKRPKTFLPALSAMLIAVVLVGLLDGPRTASAHPLGNFSVNRLAILGLKEDDLTLRYVVDSAEIPTFQEVDDVDLDHDGEISAAEATGYLSNQGATLLSNLRLKVDGNRLRLEPTGGTVELLPGQANLDTLRVVIDVTARLPDGWQDGVKASFQDDNFDGAPGWRQVVIEPGVGVSLFNTTATSEDLTHELTSYPQDLLKSPPAVSSVDFSFRAGKTALAAATDSGNTKTVSRDSANKTLGKFTELVSRQHLTPAFVLLSLLLSATWGAMHALGPGHGKTVVAAYLVGERGTVRHALYLGIIVTATHTISVFTLGAVALFASDVLNADDLYFWLSASSGVLVALFGGVLLITRLRSMLMRGHRATSAGPDHGHEHSHNHGHEHMADGHSHDHGHEHTALQHDESEHEHGHSHMPKAPGWRGLLALGISGGLVPCPTALVVMLGAIAIDRTGYGLVLVTAFSVGLATVLMSIGLLMVYGRRLLNESSSRLGLLRSPLVQRMVLVSPVLSAVAILGVGILLTSRAML